METPPGFADKVAMLERQWSALHEHGAFDYHLAGLGTWCAKHYGPAAAYFLSPSQADQAIERLGAWLRKVKAEGHAAEVLEAVKSMA